MTTVQVWNVKVLVPDIPGPTVIVSPGGPSPEYASWLQSEADGAPSRESQVYAISVSNEREVADENASYHGV